MLFLKRFPGLLYTHQNIVYSIILLLLSTVYVLFRWNIICLNFQSRRNVKQACKKYEAGNAVGSLCTPLCITHSIHSLNCQSFHPKSKEVFNAEFHDTNIIFKSTINSVQSLHWFENDVIKYPSEEEFIATIKAIVRNRLNISISHKTALSLTQLKPYYEKNDKSVRHAEMDNLWTLLHDNEYLLASLYADKDVFPQLLGTCGAYYAVEYIEPVETFTSILSQSCSQEEWERRVKTAILLIELLDELSKEFMDIFHLCNVKLEHFGIASNKNKVKFIDLNGVFSKKEIKNYLQGKGCTTDSDCKYYDCQTKCGRDKKCSAKITNNNLQILCEKLFLGWRMSTTILIPGLLMSHYTPSELASLLRQCAHINFEDTALVSEEEVRKSLYNILIEIEQGFNSESFI